MRKHYEKQRRLDCSPIAEVSLDFECRDEIVANALNRDTDSCGENCRCDHERSQWFNFAITIGVLLVRGLR